MTWVLLLTLLASPFAAAKDIPEESFVTMSEFSRIEIRDAGGQRQVWLGNAESMGLLGTVVRSDKPAPLYHWGDDAQADRWTGKGRLDARELEAMRIDPGVQLAGGGAYFSTDPLDSSSYGPRLSILEAPEGITYLHTRVRFNDPRAWPRAQEFLKAKGIQAIQFTDTWVNFIDAGPLRRIHGPQAKDFYESARFSDPNQTAIGLTDLMSLDSDRMPLTDHPWLRGRFPEFAKALSGEKLSAAEDEKLWGQLKEVLREAGSSPAKDRMRDVFHLRLVAEARAEIEKALSGPGGKVDHYDFEKAMSRAIETGVHPSEALPPSSLAGTLPTYLPRGLRLVESPTSLGEFGDQLVLALESSDRDAMLDAMAKGKPRPWDPPTLEKWRKLRSSYSSEVLTIRRSLAPKEPIALRDQPRVSPEIPVTARQRELLEANPWLVTEFRPDPGHPGAFLARYESPSARTYRRFESLLSPELKQELEAAERAGRLADPSTKEFRDLTRKTLERLCREVELSPGTAARYQALSAIQPFPDDNELTLRAHYLKNAHEPLVGMREGEALLMTHEELVARIAIGQRQHHGILQAWAREAREQPKFPRFYDVPELRRLAAAGAENCALRTISRALGR